MRHFWARVPFLIICGLSLGCSADGRPGDVLLISIDTLRPDHMGVYGYGRPTTPQIDRWFADAAIFEAAYSTEANTPPSVVSLLSGLLPQQHRVRWFYQLVPSKIRLLPDLLPVSYQTAAFVSNIVLGRAALGIDRRFDHYDDEVEESVPDPAHLVFERSAKPTTDAVLRWLRQERNPDRPLFLWVHYIDPHGPYTPPPDWRGRFEHEGAVPLSHGRMPSYQRQSGERDGLSYVDRYDEEIGSLDEQVGRLLDGYGETADASRALILLTADHGEALLERRVLFSHGFQVFEEIVRVPLLMKGPGVVPGRRRELSSGVDLLPTILAFTDGELPKDRAGVDLRSGVADAERTVFVEASVQKRQWRAAIRGRRKHVFRLKPGDRKVVGRRFFDLETDPDEHHPVRAPDDESSRALRALCESDPDPGGLPDEFRETGRPTPGIAPRAGAAGLERLRALGYVE